MAPKSETLPAKLLLIRHAQSLPSADVPEADWPLSQTGSKQAERLVAVLAEREIAAVVSSPYKRAIDTVKPFAAHANLSVHVDHDLRERLLSPQWIDDFASAVSTLHADEHARLPGGESAHEARTRFERALASIASRWPGQSIAVATHGAVIAHLLRQDHDDLPPDYHNRISNPHIFEIKWGEPRLWIDEVTLDGQPRILYRGHVV